MGLLDGIAGLFVDTSNPYEFAKGESDYYKKLASEYLDPNSPYYSSQTGKYFRQLTRSLNSATPTTDSLLALAVAGGRSQGAATSVANAQRKAIEARNRDTASSSAENFNTNIVGQGLNFANTNLGRSAEMMELYGQGQQYSQEVGNNFASSLLDLGAGLLGDYIGSKRKKESEDIMEKPNISNTPTFGGGINLGNGYMRSY